MRRALATTAACLGTGLLLGTANSLVNAVGGPYAPHPISPDGVPALMIAGAVLGTPWAWAATGLLIGLIPRPWWAAVLLAAAGLVLADVAYYVCDYLAGTAGELATVEITWWAMPAVAAGVVFGLLGWGSRRLGAWGAGCAVVAGVGLWKLREHSGADQTGDAPFTVQTALTVLLVGALAASALRRR